MSCPKCGGSLGQVNIIKGEKELGLNFYCKKINCRFEQDIYRSKKYQNTNTEL